jgi:KDO2-lipid IV(A) lauroyltransferase
MLPRIPRSLLAPRHWPTWFGAGVWYLIAQLPYRLQYGFAKLISPLLRYNKKRFQIAQTNIRLCFPELTGEQRDLLLEENLFSTCMAIFETGIAWFWPKWRLQHLYSIRGLEHLQAAQQSGQGALLLSMHFTHLDLGSAMLGRHVDYDGMYSPHKNPVYDFIQKTGRDGYSKTGTPIPRQNVRMMLSRLRQGRMVWYAPDRDLGPKVSIFVPFFGVQAATVTATGKFAQLGKAQILPFTQRRLEHGKGYELTIHPPFEHYPSGDEYQDTLRVNQFIEQQVRLYPEQYLWAQPRFKTRPDGEAPFYKGRKDKVSPSAGMDDSN